MGTNSRAHIAEQQPRLIAMYQAGASYAEIAAELGLTKKGVSYRVGQLIAAGLLERRVVKKSGPNRKTRDEAQQIAERYAGGESWADIAASLGITTQTLSYRLEQSGIQPNRVTPRWVDAQHWPWPLTLAEVAQRLYGNESAADRRHARMLVTGWLASGKLERIGWARYDKPRGKKQ